MPLQVTNKEQALLKALGMLVLIFLLVAHNDEKSSRFLVCAANVLFKAPERTASCNMFHSVCSSFALLLRRSTLCPNT